MFSGSSGGSRSARSSVSRSSGASLSGASTATADPNAPTNGGLQQQLNKKAQKMHAHNQSANRQKQDIEIEKEKWRKFYSNKGEKDIASALSFEDAHNHMETLRSHAAFQLMSGEYLGLVIGDIIQAIFAGLGSLTGHSMKAIFHLSCGLTRLAAATAAFSAGDIDAADTHWQKAKEHVCKGIYDAANGFYSDLHNIAFDDNSISKEARSQVLREYKSGGSSPHSSKADEHQKELEEQHGLGAAQAGAVQAAAAAPRPPG